MYVCGTSHTEDLLNWLDLEKLSQIDRTHVNGPSYIKIISMKELNNFADEKALLRMAQHARSLKRQGENCTT